MNNPQELYLKGDYQFAADVYRKQIAMNPANADAQEGLARCLYKLGDLSASWEAAELAIKLRPESAIAHLILSAILTGKNDLLQAELMAREAIKIDPNMWEGYNNLAGILSAARRGEEGMAFMKKALDLAPDNWQLHLSASALYFNLKRYSDGRRETRYAFLLRPSLQTIYWLFRSYLISHKLLFILGFAALALGGAALPSPISFWAKLLVVLFLLWFEIGETKYENKKRGIRGIIITLILGILYILFGHY
jgi:tetratricopeptide (TPR) repeat protein